MTPPVNRRARPRRAASRAASAASALAMAAVVAAGGCARGGSPVHVLSVRVVGESVAEPLREAGIDEASIGAATRRGLAAAGFKLGEGERPHRAEVSVLGVRLAPPEASGAPARVEIGVEVALSPTEPGKGGARRENGSAAVALGRGDPRLAWQSALQDATRNASLALALAFAEESKSVPEVVADLSSKDPAVRDHAVRVLGDRRSDSAVPALIERLKDPDPRVVHRAVGALAQIGDERAVGPLIDLSRSGDPMLVARVARLIGDIGGAEAEGYLLTLEAGHADPRVRRAAREALDDMQARAGEQATAPSARK